jgi:endonuclease YncB( thermonuclease family)
MIRRALEVRSVTLPAVLALAVGLGVSNAASAPAPTARRSAQVPAARAGAARAAAKPQPRPHGQRVGVDPSLIEIDDGDTVVIHWSKDDAETVRILGIDTAETRHIEHDIPYAQPFGPEGRAFAAGAFATARKVDLLRASTLDPYGRTLGYLFVDDRDYSVLVVQARLAYESVTFYGDNGFPEEAAAVLAAAKAAGPLPFEPPHLYRARMRDVAAWMKEHGTYPEQ